jgi:hypothetical protein
MLQDVGMIDSVACAVSKRYPVVQVHALDFRGRRVKVEVPPRDVPLGAAAQIREDAPDRLLLECRSQTRSL